MVLQVPFSFMAFMIHVQQQNKNNNVFSRRDKALAATELCTVHPCCCYQCKYQLPLQLVHMHTKKKLKKKHFLRDIVVV